jgi:dihydropyrimidine dehydrogenase (NAD+) subunit PreT
MFEVPKKRLELQLKDSKPLYTKGEALAEASRCLYCHDAPCVPACPTEIDIPTFIRKISTGNVKGAAKTILDSNILGYSCARVCPVEVLCAGACVYNDWERPPIQIGKLQRYATEWLIDSGDLRLYQKKPPTGKKIALVGGGPASLACAAHLTLEGHSCTIFERNEVPGGLNSTGVAPYKLHAEEALKEVQFVLSLGIELKTKVDIGKDIPSAKLLKEYDAVFLGLGLGEDTRLGIPGEEIPGVVGATAMIRRLKLDPTFAVEGVRDAVVIGGGNTAIDAARELAQLGVSNVTMVYRKTRHEMSGYVHEWDDAKLDGVRLIESAIPQRIVSHQEALAVELNNGMTIATRWVIVAIGQSKAHKVAEQFSGVRCDSRGCIVVNENGETGNPKVFSGGDCANGGKEVVNAVAEGKRAAIAIHSKLMNS